MADSKASYSYKDIPFNVWLNVFKAIDVQLVITDLQTDEILFANERMNACYNIDYDPVGKRCWEVYQKDQTGRCAFCALNLLEGIPDEPVVWEEHNTATGRWFRNISSIIRWTDGKNVHLKQSVDITRMKNASDIILQRLEQQQLLSAISQNFISTNDNAVLVRNALKMLGEFLGLDRILLGKIVDKKDCIEYRNVWFAPDAPRISTRALGAVLPVDKVKKAFWDEERDHTLCSDTASTNEAAFFESIHISAYLTVPLWMDNRLRGILSLEMSRDTHEWTVNDIFLGKMVSNIISGVLMRDEMLGEAESRTKAMLDATPLCANFWDRNFEVVDCNQAAVNLFGLSSKQEYLEKFYKLSPVFQPNGQRSTDMFLESIKTAFEKGVYVFEWMHEKLDGEPMPSEITLTRVRYKDGDVVIGYAKDLREIKARMAEVENTQDKLRKAVAKAEESSKAKSDFLAKMSHEIRTPMNAIIGMAELLSNERMPERQRSYVNNIRTASTALLDIINDILDISKIESGKFQLIPVDYKLKLLLDNINSLFTFETKKKNLHFKMEVLDSLPMVLYGDDIRLKQVLVNIVGNAVKFTQQGSVKLRVWASEENIYFDITDTGIGIKTEDIDRVFDTFEQFDLKRNRHAAGTGLGLPITKTIVEMMGGNISLDSVYGKGTTFHIIIPLVLGDAQNVAGVNEHKSAVSAPAVNALVVDDSEINLHVAKGLLKMYDIVCDTALSGEEAIKMVREKKYDIIFMDHMMPEMDGAEATKILREEPGGENLVIVALTANAVQGAKEMLLEAGMNDYLSKPINKEMLVKILVKWLPKDKVHKKELLSVDKDTPRLSPILDRVSKNIKYIDVLLGLQSIGFDQNAYEKALEILLHRLPSIRERLHLFLENADQKNFVVEIHGIKGSLANIGAHKLSLFAADIEKKAAKGDIAFCQRMLPEIEAPLLDMEKRLDNAFKGQMTFSDYAGKGDIDILNEKIVQIKEYLEEFASEDAADKLRTLREYDFGEEMNGRLIKLANFVDEFQYEEALRLIENQILQ